MSCPSSVDGDFGPSVSGCRRDFDFTLQFEDIFFQLLPSCLFIICSTGRIFLLLRAPPKCRLGQLYISKLVTIATLCVLQVAILVVLCKQSGETPSTISISGAVLSMIAILFLIPLSHLEHGRAIQPSLLISIYLCVTIILKSAVVRTYWLIQPYGTLASIALADVLLQLVLVVLENISKTTTAETLGMKVSREEKAGFLSRSLFTWLHNLFYTGYSRPLTPSDLQPVDPVLAASKLLRDFKAFQKHSKGRLGLVGTTIQSLGIFVFAPVLPRLCLTGFTFAQPFLTTSLINYIGATNSSDNDGYGLIGASFLVYAGIAVSTGWYWHLSYKCVTKIRGGLVGSIQAKMMRLKYEKGADAKVLTLCISDVQRILNALAFAHEFWASPIETGLATWLLWRQIGPSSLTVLGIALLATFGSTLIGKRLGAQQQIWLAATEKRISATKKALSSLKAIKMMGASARVGTAIENLRRSEFAASKGFRTLIVGTLFSSYFTLIMSPVVAFGTYLGATRATNADFNAPRMFASLILINLLASPLIRLLQIIPAFGAALGCFERIEQFLVKEERNAIQGLPANLPLRGSDDWEVTQVLPDKFSEHEGKTYPSPGSVSISKGEFGWGSESLLKDINLEIKPGEHVVITGSVACGKSLLLQAIIGEIEPKTGYVNTWGAKIAYCSQVAWLENLTARENAFRCCTEDSSWELEVVEACAVERILETQSSGETVGSGGSRLSGGERQRLALARAVASRPSILLLDDVLSAIDRTTQKVVKDKLLGPSGLLKRHHTTVIQISHDMSLVREADKAFMIQDDGHLHALDFTENGPIDAQPNSIEAVANQSLSGAEKTTKAASKDVPEHGMSALITDKKVYQTYFRSISVINVLLFFAIAVAFSFTLKFPGTYTFGYWLGLYAMLCILPLITLSIWASHTLLNIIPQSGVELHAKLLSSVLNATFAHLSTIDSGSIINRFNQDLMLIDSQLPFDLLNATSSFLTCIAQVVLVVVATVYLFAALPVLAVVLFAIQHVYLRTSKQLRQLDLQSSAGLHTKISEAWEGLVTIRTHGWQKTFRGEFQEKLDRSQEPVYLLYMVQTWLRTVMNLVVAGLAVTVAGVAVATKHSTVASGIGVAFLNLVSLGGTLTNLITAWTSLETSLGAIARIQNFEEDTPQEPEILDPIDVPVEWPAYGQVSFEEVWTTYQPTAEKEIWSLQNVTFQINAGERVAVCGRSGAGKSTLLLSLLNLIETTRGLITIDGIDISRINRSTLRSRLHVISQDAYIEGESIREALNVDSKTTDEVTREVLQSCFLLDKVSLSGGLSAKLDDLNLSVGETQLFILARTLLDSRGRRGGLVLLDEATSSIDSATEKKIFDVVWEHLKGRTVISILHRLESALEFDRILVLENGEVADFGTPAEVLQRCPLFEGLKGRPSNTVAQ